MLRLPRADIEARFGVRGDEGADIEIIGCTRGIPGGGFVYTNLDSVSVGVVVSVTGLAAAKVRPEELIADLKAHPAIEGLVAGGELMEYSAHLIPEAGWKMIPELSAGGLLIAGDAAALCLAAGIWLEGVNFAIGSGAAAGALAAAAAAAKDSSAAFLARYRADLEACFVLADHKKLAGAPGLVLSDRVQRRYPQLICNLVEGLFTVTNPEPKPGVRHLLRREAQRAGVKLRHLASDGLTALRTFG